MRGPHHGIYNAKQLPTKKQNQKTLRKPKIMQNSSHRQRRDGNPIGITGPWCREGRRPNKASLDWRCVSPKVLSWTLLANGRDVVWGFWFFFFLNQTQFSIQLEKKVKHVRLLWIFVKRNTAKEKIKMRLEKKKNGLSNLWEHPKYSPLQAKPFGKEDESR